MPPEYNYAPAPPVAPDGRPRFTGTADELAADLRALGEVGVEHVALRFSVGREPHDLADFVQQAERFTTMVAPLV